ncbi:TPA: sugar ABC transporter permease, partial [Listeria monocytogenes]|nr:sugar ABC transporter permease [Listeria monocytogenes]
MKLEQKQIKNVRQATLLSIIPGLGQFYNKQNFKGIVFFALFALFIIEFFAVGLNALIGLVTLGSVPGVDHSLFLMIEGTLQLIVT